MQQYIVKILEIENLSENIKRIRVEKPQGYKFISGHHTIVSINKPGWENKKKPFSLSSPDKEDFLEFIIKIYPERDGVTKKISRLKIGDEFIIGEARGKIAYNGNGVFISAGTGISPFISIFKSLDKKELKKSSLFYMNRTSSEIIMEKWLRENFRQNAVFTLTREEKRGYESGRIDKEFLGKHIINFNQKFYICGPFEWIRELKNSLIKFGVKKDNIISEI